MRTGAVSGLAARDLARPGIAGRHAVRRGRPGAHAAGGALARPAGARRGPRRRLDPGADRALRRAEGRGRPPIVPFDDPASGRRRARARPGDHGAVAVRRRGLARRRVARALRVVARHRGGRRRVMPISSSSTTSTTRRSIPRGRSRGRVRRACSRDDEVVPLGAIIAGDHPGRTGDERADRRLSRRHRDRGRRLRHGRVPTGARDSGVGSTQRLWNEPIWT